MTIAGLRHSKPQRRLARSDGAFLIAGLLGVAVLAAGCAKHAGLMKPSAAEAETDPLNQRVADLRLHAEQLSTLAVKLPGRTTEEHVTLMRESFDQLSKILPLLYGSDQPGTFRQIVRTIETQRDSLSNASLNSEPVIDTGLRSTIDGLGALSQERLYTGAGVAQTIDQAREKLSELDTTRGAIHQLVAGQIVGQINRAVASMTRELTRRAATETDGTASTKPAATSNPTPLETAPAEPEMPANPAKPSDPNVPADPSVPDAAAPSEPKTPADPAAPDAPKTPDAPEPPGAEKPTPPDENK